jgi:predicted TPR repeat methyltransferase
LPQDATTFLDLDYWLEVNILRAAKLGLHRRSGIAVLDLGSGTGLLLYICEVLGHRAIGLDLPKQMLQTPEREIYIELSRASEVKGHSPRNSSF